MHRKLIFLLNLFLILCLIISKAQAESTRKGLIINEVMPDPKGSDTLLEWIELKNTSSEIINLNTWQFNSKKLPDQVVQPNEIIILARDTQSVINQYKVSNRIIKYSFSLNNSGAQLELKKGDIVNLFTYPKSREDISFELLSGDCNTLKGNSISNTIGKENTSCYTPISIIPINYNEKINITKICPAIKDGNEYLEIKNTTNSAINMDGWKLADLKSSELLSGINIQPQKTMQIFPKNITLNDDGDTIILNHPNNGFVSTMIYPKMKENECFPSITRPTKAIAILPPASNTKPTLEIKKDTNAKNGVGLGLVLELKIPKLFRILFSF